VPPFSEFPPDLAGILNGYSAVIDGGLHIDGSQEAPIVESQVIEQCKAIKQRGISAVVIAGVFSPTDETFHQETRVRDIMLREIPGADIVCSHEVANIGFLERENASILNAGILAYARTTVRRFKRAMRSLNLTCPLFITQNDGTILDSASAARIPIRTFSSGATNSMRGAAYLARLDGGGSSAIVVDIGGTTSDVGVILPSGLPRQASAYVTVAGVRVNYSMPQLHSVGLGGGSLVRADDQGIVKVGPESVGHFLLEKALVFGGSVCTASDIAVATDRATMGDISKAKALDSPFVEDATKRIKSLLERAIEVVKTSPDPVPVLLVGGGAVLAPDHLDGASTLIRPPFHDVANAVGAAICKVCGSVDIVQGTTHQTETQAIEHAKKLAIERAIAAGAIPSSVTIAEVESMPLQYVANRIRTIVKAIGEIDFHATLAAEESDEANSGEIDEEEAEEAAKNFAVKVTEHERVDPVAYRPVIRKSEAGVDEWMISETDLAWIADGCYVLGCAGGGTPQPSFIQLRDMLRKGHEIRVIDQSALKETDLIMWGGHMVSCSTMGASRGSSANS
jgi:N-methylhydantoinase A/oxoprolinase/acetone carboxylase beta subunit